MPDNSLPIVAPPAPHLVRDAVRTALAEDLVSADITTDSCVPADQVGGARLIAREPLVVAGLPIFEACFADVDSNTRVQVLIPDGSRASKGSAIVEVSGLARSILKAERVALNFVQGLSGIASLTCRFVDRVPEGCRARITDTRKTTPGLRALERYAVRCGGGYNHRDNLGSAVLIKDNHIAAAGGVIGAVRAARNFAPHTSRIECEVDSLEQLAQALEAGADIVLLDNFDDAQVKDAVAQVNGRALIEVSGRVELERIETLATMGVDIISVGALTHSARAADLGLDWKENGAGRSR